MALQRNGPPNPRRFYADVDVGTTKAGSAVRLDGRAARSPAGRTLSLPTRALADLVAAEWAVQGEWVVWSAMPATRLAFTVLDAVAPAREMSVAAVVGQAGADLLCYPAEAPSALVARQVATWSPLLAWARNDLSLAFVQAHGILHRPQPPRTLARLAVMLRDMDDFALAAVAFATALFGSAILALAVWRGRLDGAAAFAASRVDETFQEDQWGIDAESAARNRLLAADATTVGQWLAAC